MRIEPFWNADYKNLNYSLDYFRDQTQVDFWKDKGHNIENTSMAVYPVKENNDFTNTISSFFPNLNYIGFCFHRLDPGHYLPTHEDRYGFYAKKHNIIDLDQIKRYIIFLEKGYDGHLLIVNNKVYSNWDAGDIVGWKGTTPHSAINLGMKERYTLQITGIEK